MFNSAYCVNPEINAVNLYNLTSGENMGGWSCANNDDDMRNFFDVPFPVVGYRYSLIEITEGGVCEHQGLLTYAECKARPEYVGEFLFEVKIAPPSPQFPKSILAHRPEVLINFPQAGDFIGSSTTTIRYTAVDQDNALYPAFGFGEAPIDIYYSEDKENWARIKEKEKNNGEFLWLTDFLAEGNYWLKIRARDEGGEADEEIVGPFALDSLAPFFEVIADPSVSRGERVKITVNVSEQLLQSPEVIVRQRGYADVPVFVQKLAEVESRSNRDSTSESSIWVGEYEVRSGADGTAVISVSGQDRAGNMGTSIRKGGIFSVGLEPPPTPIIASPLDGAVAGTSTIDISGRIREDTKAVIWVNDSKVGEARPDTKGDFIAQNIQLSRDSNRGLNLLKVFSEDTAGNSSEPAVFSVKFNSAPIIAITEPSFGATTSATTTILIDGRDDNLDRLTYIIEASSDGGATFQEVVKEHARAEYQWNTREFPDGEYILRITAFDGFEKSVATSSTFLIRNFLPVITLERQVSTNKPSVVLKGSATSPLPRRSGNERSFIARIEYSGDNGLTWQGIVARDGAYDSESEIFDLDLKDLSEDRHEFLIRAYDSRRLRGRTRLAVTADFTLPSVPLLIKPASGEILADADDVNKTKAGTQVLLEGSAEPGVMVRAIAGSEVFEAQSGDDGKFRLETTLYAHGNNLFKISAIDRAGNESRGATEFGLVYNNPPDIKFLRPKENGGLNHVSEILFEIQDRDLDPVIKRSVYYRRPGEEREILLAANLSGNSYKWDVGGLPQGIYELIIEAGDGVSAGKASRKFAVDNTPPEVLFTPLAQNVYREEFVLKMQGRAQDDFSGIEYVEYKINRVSKSLEVEPPSGGSTSLDLGQWFKATLTSGYREKDASFLVRHPVTLRDGEYEIKFRATDSAGNVSRESPAQEIIVDTTPPRVGSHTISRGPLTFLPSDGAYELLAGENFEFVISLERDTASSTLILGSNAFNLQKQAGLWIAKIAIPQKARSGGDVAELLILAEDNFGNSITPQKIGEMKILARGRTLKETDKTSLAGVELTAVALNAHGDERMVFDAGQYGLENPIFSGEAGDYVLLLPSGTYEIMLEKRGFKRVRTEKFTIFSPAYIAEDLQMEPRRGIRGFFEDLLESWSD